MAGSHGPGEGQAGRRARADHVRREDPVPTVKVLSLLSADGLNLAQAPWGFLVLFVLHFVVGLLMLSATPGRPSRSSR